MTFSTVAIILRRRDVGEWDRLYTTYTREHGKLVFIGKGTRRAKAKLSSHLEPYSETDLVIARGRSVDRVTFARAIASGLRFTGDWEALRTAAFICECADQLTREAHRDVALYDLLCDALRVIASPASLVCHCEEPRDEAIPAPSVAVPFLLRLLSVLGYAPQTDRCVECRGELSYGTVVGVPLRGGAACARCASSIRNGIPLTHEDRAQLTAAVASFGPFPPSPALAAFAYGMLEAHIWQPLRTSFAIPALTSAPAAVTMATS